MSDPTIAEHFMATADALGLTPRQRREGLDQIQAAAERIEAAEPSDRGSADG